VAGAVAGAIAGEVHWQLLRHAASASDHTPALVGAFLSGLLVVAALASVLVAARRTDWPPLRAIGPPSVVAAILTAPTGYINGSTRGAFVAVYLLSGAIAGAAALVATARTRSMALGAALGAAGALVIGFVAPLTLSGASFVFVYYVLGIGLAGGGIAVAIARSPVRRR
jgi:hypothetical protein